MAVELYPEFFNDVFGPVMQPGSSSHTAAPCRLAYLAHCLLGEDSTEIRVQLDRDGSFAGTFGMMYEDNAMLAGAMGFLPDDIRLFAADRLAAEAGIAHAFDFCQMKESTHINAIKLILTGRSGRTVTLVGDSTGGGMIETQLICGYPLQLKGDSYVLLIFDPLETLPAGKETELAGELSALVEAGTVAQPGRGQLWFFKTADPPSMDRLRALLPGVEMSLLRPVLPVLTRPERKPQLFDSMTRWREIARQRGMTLWETAVQYEMDASGWPRDRVIATMRDLAAKMHRQTHAVYDEEIVFPEGPFKRNMAADWARRMDSPGRLTDNLTADTLRWAYGAGAGIPGVEVVAGPMGSGGGYVYAALYAVQQARGYSDEDLLHGLIVAAGVGAIAFSRTDPTGEVIGCTGECGVCGAMAAAGIVELVGGSPEQAENAASLLLQATTGWPCDPIPGGHGQPCRSRIITATCMAHVFADLALAGREAVLPLHEAIDVADAVGRRLPPELLCTSLGGAAATPTGRQCAASYRAWCERTVQEGTPRPPGNLI